MPTNNQHSYDNGRIMAKSAPEPDLKLSSSTAILALQYAAPQIEQQIAPILRTFARPVGEADELFAFPLASRRSTPECTASRLRAGQLNAVRPNVDVELRRQIAFLPGIVLVDPTILETGNGAPLLTVTNELPRAATRTTIDKSSSATSTSGTTLRLLELACVLPEAGGMATPVESCQISGIRKS